MYKWKTKLIKIYFVDIYYNVNDKIIEGTTTKDGIFIGLPHKPTNEFISTLFHELIHSNLLNKYDEDNEEILAQILGIKITKLILGKVPDQSIKIAKRRIKKITGKDYKIIEKELITKG